MLRVVDERQIVELAGDLHVEVRARLDRHAAILGRGLNGNVRAT
jgi:hypothetical protein